MLQVPGSAPRRLFVRAGPPTPWACRAPGDANFDYWGSPKVNTTLPAAMVTYCCPSTA